VSGQRSADHMLTICSVYRVFEDGESERLAKLDNIPLRKTTDGESGKFIGIYSNGHEFPHGTKVVVLYPRAGGGEPLRACTTMFYH